MIRSAIPLVALFLAGCAAAPPAPPPVVEIPKPLAIASSTASPIVDAAPPPPPPAATEPPPVGLPEHPACVLEAKRWRGVKGVTPLRFREGGPAFAQIAGGKGRLHLPPGQGSGGAALEIADESLAVRGYLAGEDVWLNAARAIVMGQFMIPHARSRLVWISAEPGLVTVTFTPERGVALAQPTLITSVPCEALGFDLASFDARRAIPDLKPGKRGVLRVDAILPLSVYPGAPPVASLDAASGQDVEITVMETVGSNARIAWDRGDALIFGWIPASGLRVPTPPPALFGRGTGSGSGFGRSIHPISTVVCKDDVPLIAEVGGERFTVGRILAGATINRMDAGLEETEVVVASGVISFPPAVKMRVRTERLLGCPAKAP